MFLAFTKGKEHYYNIANLNNLISIKDLAELIASLDPKGKCTVRYAKEESGLQYLPFKLGIMDIDRILSLGWRPQVDLKNAFRYTLEYYLQQNK